MANKIERYTEVLPDEVKSAYRAAGNDMNLGLRMAKDVRVGVDSNGKTAFNFYRGGPTESGAAGTDFGTPTFEGVPFVELTQRTQAIAQGYSSRSRKDHHRAIEMQQAGRLVIGMGQASVYENGFTLHPVFGCPYLPGSSLKGVTRRSYIDEYHGGDEATALDDRTFCDLFGCTGQTSVELENGKHEDFPSWYKTNGTGSDLGDRRGALIFFDAFPGEAPKIEVDILTPHYTPYYEKALPPADIYNPIPVNFLTVGGGASYVVALAIDPLVDSTLSPDDFEKAFEALRLALTEDGIGGKTTVGYGRFVDAAAEKERIAQVEVDAKETAAAAAKIEAGVVTVDDIPYVDASTLKKRKGGSYKVNVRVVSKQGRKFTFEPLVNELRGKHSIPIFMNLELEEGDVLQEVEITGVNFGKQLYSISQKTIQKR